MNDLRFEATGDPRSEGLVRAVYQSLARGSRRAARVSQSELRVPIEFRRNYSTQDEEATIDGAVWLIDHMCGHVGLKDSR